MDFHRKKSALWHQTFSANYNNHIKGVKWRDNTTLLTLLYVINYRKHSMNDNDTQVNLHKTYHMVEIVYQHYSEDIKLIRLIYKNTGL